MPLVKLEAITMEESVEFLGNLVKNTYMHIHEKLAWEEMTQALLDIRILKVNTRVSYPVLPMN